MREIQPNYKTTYLLDMEGFLKRVKASDLRATDKRNAPSWFHDTYLTAILAREALIDENAERQAAAAEKRIAISLGLGAVATLLVFLIIPLLIRIEQNTRVVALSDPD